MSSTVDEMVAHLENDKDFQTDIQSKIIQDAIAHWMNIKRLPREEAEDLFNDHWRVKSVFAKISALQAACAKENVPFPLDKVMHLDIPAKKNEEAKQDKPLTNTTPEMSQPELRKTVEEVQKMLDRATKEVEEEAGDDAGVDGVEALPVFSPGLLSIDPINVMKWWSVQFLLIAIYWSSV